MSEKVVETNQTRKTQNCITFSDNLEADQYVSQFLSIVGSISGGQNSSQENKVFQEDESGSLYIESEPKVSKRKTKRRRSSFHNCQKHLVTTLRTSIRASQIGENSPTRACQLLIWKCFMNSKKLNKALLCLALDNLTSESRQKLESYGFGEVLEKFENSQIQQAQKNLIKEVTRQLRSIDLNSTIQDRRIRNKNQFMIYFKEFYQQLQKGQINKRMTKWTKLLQFNAQ